LFSLLLLIQFLYFYLASNETHPTTSFRMPSERPIITTLNEFVIIDKV